MNMVRIGCFLKALRKEKELTQEQLAEMFNVSRRTVSRWETGQNIPDLDLLIELSDYYQVEIRELLDGKRKKEKINTEEQETVRTVIELSYEDRKRLLKRMNILFIIGLFIAVIEMFLVFNDNADHFLGGFCQGVMLGYMIVGCIITSKYAVRINRFKRKLLSK